MKIILNILCWVLTVFCLCFPFAYFHKDMDKKEVKISHILVNTKEEANQIRNEIIQNKKPFEEMVQKYSLCETKEDNGNLGYNMKGKLLKELENSAFKLNKFEISEPIQSEYGWHIVKVYDIKYFSDRENFERRYF